MLKNRFGLGVIVGIVLALTIMGAATAIGDAFKSWRTHGGTVIAETSDTYLQQGNPDSTTYASQCPLIAPAAKLLAAINMANAGDKSMLPLIIDVRPQSEYLVGHIPGAVWIADWYNMARPENLDKVDLALAEHIANGGPNKVVVYCHTGHKSSFVSTMLGALGYNVHSLKFGYRIGWQRDLAPLYSTTEGILPQAGPIEKDTINIVGEPKNPAEIKQLIDNALANPIQQED